MSRVPRVAHACRHVPSSRKRGNAGAKADAGLSPGFQPLSGARLHVFRRSGRQHQLPGHWPRPTAKTTALEDGRVPQRFQMVRMVSRPLTTVVCTCDTGMNYRDVGEQESIKFFQPISAIRPSEAGPGWKFFPGGHGASPGCSGGLGSYYRILS